MKSRKFLSRKAFTLIEVTITIGIVGFAVVSLLSLMPAGLAAFQQAINKTIESQILMGIDAELRQMKYTALTSSLGSKKIYFYDDQGLEVSEEKSAYSATVIGSGYAEMPGGEINNNVARVHVIITNKTSSKYKAYFVLYIANEGQ